MAITVPRPKLTWSERLYLPAIAAGMAITLRHLKDMLLGRTRVTMQYPEQKWDAQLPEHYRGAPALVKDEAGRIRCVACQLCEFSWAPRGSKSEPGEHSATSRIRQHEKCPRELDICMTRCTLRGRCAQGR